MLQKRISKALEARPELFNDEFKESIIKGVVKIGMNIDQAILAGGDYFFAVSADQKVWGKDPNPYQVMDAQLFNPDDSDIKLTFNNNTQFDGEEPVSFRVQILRGKVASITKL
jgi:hypothetical protein